MTRYVVRHKNSEGFTLIELLIVIAIIAILAAIAIPQFAEYRARGIESSMVADLKNAGTAMYAVFYDCQDYTVANLPAGPGPVNLSLTGTGGANPNSPCVATPSVQNVRISTGDTVTPGAITINSFQLCTSNPTAIRVGRGAVATDERGVIGWGATCPAAIAFIAAIP